MRTSPNRLPTIAPCDYTAEQRKAADDFLATRKVPVFGPFEPLMHSPQVMSLARATGDYLRYHAAIGNRLSELVILITARAWNQNYEWYVHYPIALQVGISKQTADAVAEGRRPAAMPEDEEIVYDFSTQLHHSKAVSDMTYARALKRFGHRGVVDLTGINAYYALLAMHMNVAEYQLPADGKKLPRLPG